MPKEEATKLETEENAEEDILYTVKAKYYRLSAGSEEGWKDRGVGTLKLYRHKVTGKTRMVMRNSIGKVGLNASVSTGMEFERMGGKRSR